MWCSVKRPGFSSHLRKYFVEFKEKALHQIIEMVRLESCSLQRAYGEVGGLFGVSEHT